MSWKCGFCGQEDTIIHAYVECNNVKPIITWISTLYHNRLSRDLLMEECIFNFKTSNENFKILNYLCNLVKNSIYKTIVNKRTDKRVTDPVLIFKSKFYSRMQTEYAYACLRNNVHGFIKKWALGGALLDVVNSELVFHV